MPHALFRALTLSLLALAGCTTSFGLDQLRERPDATVTDAPPTDARDVPVTPDLPPGTSCGTVNSPCCAPDAAPSMCNASLVCSGGVCTPCPGSLAACDGSCVDFLASPVHCGRCGNACADGQSCASGTCRLACAAGLMACGGRCVQPLSDVGHCGTCGNPCAYAHASGTCQSGSCVMGRCDTGYADCDANPANGCETSLSSPTSCGACRVTCAPPNARDAMCSDRGCAFSACTPGFADCDTNPSNGCEVNTGTNAANCGGCGTRCADGATCAAGVCQTAVVCPTGMSECVAGAPTCETTVATDAANCGACGNVCTLPGARSGCAGGACTVTDCAAGLGNCDGTAANGCETNTLTSLDHCGRCGSACRPAHGTGACAMGVCQIASCEDGFADCNNNPADGCEVDTRASTSNCGACGARCELANATGACAAGRCAVATCGEGFADCDTNAANGCEVDTRVSAASCGACGAVCALPNATTSCAAGRCSFTGCAGGFGDCDSDPANGCEANTQSDASRCGRCGTACAVANATAACVAGRCAVGACSAGYADCNSDATDGCEAGLNFDPRSCGACGRACAAGQVCTAGVCRTECAPGQTLCGSSCVDTRVSTANCGGCGRACPARSNVTTSCVDGACRYACNPGFGDCNGGSDGCEADLRNDRGHCGACGARCPSYNRTVASCTMSVCTYRCEANYGNCDGMTSNGCEVDLRMDTRNCGGCMRPCAAPNASTTCSNSSCVVTACAAGFANCDGAASTGCEARLGTNTTCSSCSDVCASGATCVVRTCACPALQTACSGRCVVTANDTANCGSCGRVCSTGQRCVLGACIGG